MIKSSIILLMALALSACQTTNIAKVEQNDEVKKTNCSSAPTTGSRVKRKQC